MEISAVFILAMGKHPSIYFEAPNTPSAASWTRTCYFWEHMVRGVLKRDGLVSHSDKYYQCVCVGGSRGVRVGDEVCVYMHAACMVCVFVHLCEGKLRLTQVSVEI